MRGSTSSNLQLNMYLNFRLKFSSNLWFFHFYVMQLFSADAKGQLILKAILPRRMYGLLTSPKKQTDEFVLFAFSLFEVNESNSSVRFLGETTACQSAFWFYLTFKYDLRK